MSKTRIPFYVMLQVFSQIRHFLNAVSKHKIFNCLCIKSLVPPIPFSSYHLTLTYINLLQIVLSRFSSDEGIHLYFLLQDPASYPQMYD